VLARSGHRVVGFDASMTSVRVAATHPERHPVALADAVRLPLLDDAADLAIAFMSLHDFDDAAAAEVARVLAPDMSTSHLRGRLLTPAGNEDSPAGLADSYCVDASPGRDWSWSIGIWSPWRWTTFHSPSSRR